MINLGEKIKLFREKNKISKSELARRLDVSPAYVTMLENGKKENPSTSLIINLAKILDVKPSELDPELIKWDKEMPRMQKELKLVEAIDLILKERGHKVSDFSEDEYNKIEKSIIEYLDTIAYMKK